MAVEGAENVGRAAGETRFTAESALPYPRERVFAWHERPGALARLTPPWERVTVVSREGTIHDGDVTIFKVGVGPVKVEWEARHEGYKPPEEFCDQQVRGPFASWHHRHSFEPLPAGTRARDVIHHRLPGGAMGRSLGRDKVEAMLHRMFAHRHHTLAADLRRHASYTGKPLRVLVAGASGLVGSALCAFLSTGGHEVIRLVRAQSSPPADAVGRAVAWDPAAQSLDLAGVGPVDAVINVAGENVGAARWTPEFKQRLRTSRVDLTHFLARQIAQMNPRPAVFVNASAMGFYGERGDESVTEGSPRGVGFLSELSQDWEAAVAPAREAGTRVVLPRIGLVLDPQEGVLGKMLPVFRAGLGGKLGSGRQWMSWIALDDVVDVFHRALIDESLEGPVNASAPAPVTNADFTRALGRVLGRSTIFSVPGPALKLAMGEMGVVALSSTKMLPQRLLSAGFGFRFPTLEAALAHALGRMPLSPLERTAEGAHARYVAPPFG